MTSWSLLPTDILDIIFEYLVLKNDNGFRTNWYQAKDIRSCQQTCKSWAVIAQMHLYKYVKLDTYGRAELFINSLRDYNLGSLVKAISFCRITDKSSNGRKLLSLLRQIDYFCPDLKKLKTSSDSSSPVWKRIRIERSKGAFLKLQVISPPHLNMYQVITQYYGVAYSLKETLRELTLYVGNSAPPIENLKFFTNIDTLYFKLDSFADVYTVAQELERCSYVESIDIEATVPLGHIMFKEYLLMRDARISFPVRICPQVKQLSVRDVPCDSKLCDYLMDVFPNLNKLEILNSSTTMPQTLNGVQNNTAYQFLSYLMKMPNARVDYFSVKDQEDFLMNFHDINDMNKHLSISYRRQARSSIYLKISAKQKIDIAVVMNFHCKNIFYLPRLGMIEKSGKKFRSLTVDMNRIFSKSEFDISDDGTDLYRILLNCLNLKNICIKYALLPCFSVYGEHQRLRLSLHTLEMDSCDFRNSYLSDLSCHVNYIDSLTIREDIFIESRAINMPETEFYNINYFRAKPFPRIFLKLEKTVDGSVDWYVSKDNRPEICTEEDFEASLHDESSMSIFICCVDVRMIKLDTRKIKVTFKT